jgi:hypothetical protein
MRGDSLRDLYAKTVAVCGLGLLAGVGALVDYWPTATVLPFVRPAFPEPVLVTALPVPEHLPVMPEVQAASERPVRLARVLSTPTALPRLAVTPAVDLTFGSSVALAVPPLFLGAAPAQATDGAEVALTAPVEPTTVVAMYTAPVSSGQDQENGFISGAAGAFKTAGSSIASAGSKTGAFIGGAIRGVMRRVNPFN